MTTAIEQAKREMYNRLSNLKACLSHSHLSGNLFELSLEDYLEQLRQQYEEMAATAHSRFESIQSLEAANQHLIEQLAKMTESRDMFRNLHQAATHAAIEHASQASTSGQTSGDRASCEQPGAKEVTIDWDGEGLPPVGTVCEYHASYVGTQNQYAECEVIAHFDGELSRLAAYVHTQHDGTRLVGQGTANAFRPIRTPEQIAAEERAAAIKEMTNSNDHAVLRDWAAYVYDQLGYRKQEKPSCMHSFFAIGSDQMKCTFCGVGKPVCEYCGGDGYVHCNGGRPTAPCPNGCQ